MTNRDTRFLDLPPIWDRVTKFAPMALVFVPIWVGVQVLVVSGFDRAVALTIVAESDPPKLITGVIVSGGWALLVVLSGAILMDLHRKVPFGFRAWAQSPAVVNRAPVIAISLWGTIVWAPAFAVASIAALGLYLPLAALYRKLLAFVSGDSRVLRAFTSSAVTASAALAVVVLLLSFFGSAWISSEVVKDSDGAIVAVGAIISADSGEWVVLTERDPNVMIPGLIGDRDIVRIKSSPGLSRESCRSLPSLTMLLLIRDAVDKGFELGACPEFPEPASAESRALPLSYWIPSGVVVLVLGWASWKRVAELGKGSGSSRSEATAQ